MAQQSSLKTDDQIPSHPLDQMEQEQESPFFLSSHNHDVKEGIQDYSSSASKEIMALLPEEGVSASEKKESDNVVAEDSGREKLKRHRVEVAGRVWIPEMWGQEDLLKDWVDCTAFDAPLVPSRITTARAALVQEGTTPNAARLTIENRCLNSPLIPY